MPQLLKSLFRNAGIPTDRSFEGQDRWEAHLGAQHSLMVGDGSDPNAGGGGEGDDDGGSGDDGDGDDQNPTGKSGKMSDAEAKLLRESMERKKKLKEANEALSAANAKLKEFDGVDPAKYKKLLDEQQARESEALEAKGQWDALKKQMADAHNEALTAERNKTKEAEDRAKAAEAQIAELRISTAFGMSKYIPEELGVSVGKAHKLWAEHCEVVDGEVVVYNKPAGKKGRVVLVDAQGDPLSFDAALAKLVDADPDKDDLLKSKLKPGAGSGGDGAGKPPMKDSGLQGKSRIAAALAAKKQKT